MRIFKVSILLGTLVLILACSKDSTSGKSEEIITDTGKREFFQSHSKSTISQDTIDYRKWHYKISKGPNGDSAFSAYVTSLNTITDQEFQTEILQMIAIKQRKKSINVTIHSNGILNCGNDHCVILVSTDNSKEEAYSVDQYYNENSTSSFLSISKPEKFVEKIKKADRIRIISEYAKAKRRAFEFDVSNLSIKQ